MKKIAFLLMFCLGITNVYALNKDGTNKVELCVTNQGKHVCDMVQEKEVYKIVYDQKYNSYFSMMMEDFDSMGFENHYFVDDIKGYTKCYADAFAKEITIEDVNMIYNENISQSVKDAIINNIANKYIEKCKSKYAPYVNSLEEVADAYLQKVCGSSKPSESVAKKCKKKYTDSEDIIKCMYENDDFYKCLEKVASSFKDEN